MLKGSCMATFNEKLAMGWKIHEAAEDILFLLD